MRFRNLGPIGVLAVAGILTAAPTPASGAILEGDPDNYSTLYRELSFGSPQQGAFEESATGALNLSVVDFSGTAIEFYRPILQFDLGEMDAPAVSAHLSVYVTNKSDNAQFDVHVYGSQNNRSSTVAYDDFGAVDEFFNAPGDYFRLHDADESLIDRDDDAGQRYSIEITSFLNARYADYLADPDESIVLIRLQPHTTYRRGDGIDTTISIAGGGASAGARPRIAFQPIPEPASVALLGIGGLLMLRRRQR